MNTQEQIYQGTFTLTTFDLKNKSHFYPQTDNIKINTGNFKELSIDMKGTEGASLIVKFTGGVRLDNNTSVGLNQLLIILEEGNNTHTKKDVLYSNSDIQFHLGLPNEYFDTESIDDLDVQKIELTVSFQFL